MWRALVLKNRGTSLVRASLKILSFALLLFCGVALATSTPKTFTYQGRFLNATGDTPITGNLTVVVEIYEDAVAPNCLMYAEHHTINTPDGLFSIMIGTGTKNSSYLTFPDDPNWSMDYIFNNNHEFVGANCPVQTFAGNTQRKLRLHVYDGSSWVTLNDQIITAVPQAVVAETLQGREAIGFAQVWTTATRPNSATGLQSGVVGFNKTTERLETWNGASWINVSPKFSSSVISDLATVGHVLKWSGTEWEPASVNTLLGNAAGDLDGTWPNITVKGLDGQPVNAAAPVAGQVLKYVAGQWVAANENGVGSTAPLSSGYIWIGDNTGSGIAQERIVSGDATLDPAGVLTIANDAITTSKILNGAVTDDKINSVSVDKVSSGAGKYLTYQPNGVACAGDDYLKWDGANWVCGDSSDLDLSGYLKANGSTPLTGDWAVGGKNISGVDGLTSNAVTSGQVNTNHLYFSEQNASPATAANYGIVYVKDDQKIYFKDSSGAEHDLTDTGSSGITDLNGQTGATQTFGAIDTGVGPLAPTWSSAANVHTLKIPMASDAGVTAGLISKGDFDRILTDGTINDATLRWDGNKWVQTDGIKIDPAGDVKFKNGVSVNEFSSNASLGGATPSDSKIPTEQAVKTYVDTMFGLSAVVGAGAFDGQILRWNSGASEWQPYSLGDAKVLVGVGAHDSLAVSLSGDAAIDNTGALTVTGIHGKAIHAMAPTNKGQIYFWDQADSKWRVSDANDASNGDVLVWDDTLNGGQGAWKAAAPAASGTTISGGTQNILAKFNSGGNNIENSAVIDNGTAGVSFTNRMITFGTDRMLHQQGNTTSIFLGSGNTTNTGFYNVASGVDSLSANTVGSYNTAIGQAALYSNINGSNNTASGAGALSSNTAGSYNTAIGQATLYSNTIGARNVAGGADALYFNIDGSDNTASGAGALRYNISGSGNTASGADALSSNTAGSYNTAIGQQALYSNKGKRGSTAVGYQSMKNANDIATTSYAHNTAVGYQSLMGSVTAANNTGTGNIALGAQALYSNTSGSDNTVSGAGALYSNTIGSSNVVSGYLALYYNTEGDRNIASGREALYYNTTGSNNIATGYRALYYNTGNNNIASGYQALYSNTTGVTNIAVGYQALYYNTAGSNNVAIGDLAGSNSQGSNNVFVGTSAGSSETGSNKLYIRNLIRGDFSTSRVGIARAPTTYNFEVQGSAGKTDGSTAWDVVSDIRLKKDIQPFTYGLDEILKLHVVHFKYKEDNPIGMDSQKTHSGFIAQEVLEVIPEAVNLRSDGYYDLNVDPIHWASIKAIQELHGQCKMSADQISSLDARVVSVERSVASLENDRDELLKNNARLENKILDLEEKISLLEKTIYEKVLNEKK